MTTNVWVLDDSPSAVSLTQPMFSGLDVELRYFDTAELIGGTDAELRALKERGDLKPGGALRRMDRHTAPSIALVDMDLSSAVNSNGAMERRSSCFRAMRQLTAAGIPFAVYSQPFETTAARRFAILLACRLFAPLAVLNKDGGHSVILNGATKRLPEVFDEILLEGQPLNDSVTQMFRPPARGSFLDKLLPDYEHYLVLREQSLTSDGPNTLSTRLNISTRANKGYNSDAVQLLSQWTRPDPQIEMLGFIPPEKTTHGAIMAAMRGFAAQNSLALADDELEIVLRETLWSKPKRRS